MQLFISHASEDKDFVHPLAAALKIKFNVWYDEYVLRVGDSLLTQIDAGLAASDYGVVVLSPSFFQKEWPQAELNGLFALERKEKKMILPIWKDIDCNGVAAYSPILAGRLAALASSGVEKVVESLEMAISSAERSAELSQLASFVGKLRELDSTLAERQRADARLYTSEGVKDVYAEFKKITVELEKQLTAVSESATVMKFSYHWIQEQSIFEVRGPFRLRLNLHMQIFAINSLTDARLDVVLYKLGELEHFGERGEPSDLRKMHFKPYFGKNLEVVWTSPNGRAHAHSTAYLLTLLTQLLYSELQRKLE